LDISEGQHMKILTLTLRLCSLIGLTTLFGMIAPAQAGVSVVVAPPAVVIGAPAVVVAPPPPAVAYAPAPFDVYITTAAPADIVFFHGDTFVWAVDANGHRYRRFYAHGDHRQELFHRRDELHRIAARNGGHLPDHHAEVRHEEHREAEHREEHR
jgi:hypothetical protein